MIAEEVVNDFLVGDACPFTANVWHEHRGVDEMFHRYMYLLDSREWSACANFDDCLSVSGRSISEA